MSKLPWMKFYPADWSQDTVSLSLAGRGAWITIVCAMWRSEERGKLSMPLAGFCRLLGAAEPETIAVLEELNVTGIASRVTEADKKVTLVCRRMVREHNSYRTHALRQQRYREAHQCDARVTGEKSEVRSQKSEVRSQKSEEEEEKNTNSITNSIPREGIKGGIKVLNLDFDQFWQAYPRKQGKKKALSSWQSSTGSIPELEPLLNLLELHKKSDQWTKDNGRFIPLPATWLNQERWTDEINIQQERKPRSVLT